MIALCYFGISYKYYVFQTISKSQCLPEFCIVPLVASYTRNFVKPISAIRIASNQRLQASRHCLLNEIKLFSKVNL
ncbi:hypothetical protein D7V86_14370 [bacterium D16-51]|nr:hypothetical protein D7V96_18515 [bacterium D16-59]RKI59023.1 hypothetical protein D7V86_14370 [bacterium D16-51]